MEEKRPDRGQPCAGHVLVLQQLRLQRKHFLLHPYTIHLLLRNAEGRRLLLLFFGNRSQTMRYRSMWTGQATRPLLYLRSSNAPSN